MADLYRLVMLQTTLGCTVNSLWSCCCALRMPGVLWRHWWSRALVIRQRHRRTPAPLPGPRRRASATGSRVPTVNRRRRPPLPVAVSASRGLWE